MAIRWFVSDDALGEAAIEARRRFAPHAPSFLIVETAHVLNKYVRSLRLDAQAARAMVGWTANNVALTPDVDLVDQAQEIAAALEHGVYDCLYAALASRMRATLVTADFTFARKLQSEGRVPVLALGAEPI